MDQIAQERFWLRMKNCQFEKKFFEELSQIRKSFGNKKVTGFDIFDSFQYSKKRKFSVEFLEENTIEVIRIKEE